MIVNLDLKGPNLRGALEDGVLKVVNEDTILECEGPWEC